MELSEMDKKFIVECILLAAEESFPFENSFTVDDIMDLLSRLGVTEENLKRYKMIYF